MRPQNRCGDVVAGSEQTVLARLVPEDAIQIIIGDVQGTVPRVEGHVRGFDREPLERPSGDQVPLPPHDEEVAPLPERRHLVHLGITDEEAMGPRIVGDPHRVRTRRGPDRGEADANHLPGGGAHRWRPERRQQRDTEADVDQALHASPFGGIGCRRVPPRPVLETTRRLGRLIGCGGSRFRSES